MTFSHSVRVYYADTDAGGIVYHARYLEFAERARAEAMRAAGLPHVEMVNRHNVMFVVRRVELAYQRPARIDDVIRIETVFLDVAGASLALRQVFWRDSDSLAVLKLGLACVRVADGRPARLPADVRAGFLGCGNKE